ncbi:hypothetical protein C475_00075 [Halosimplex carlsbadense 2-9-1]|uniref:Uncharacterized protein n=1 Tax=Halosimplex carlsbadense 2-9-1 TaxID=797114 RepID=M0D6R2_9EURY|nr:DUF58 domain-containing protein [Halosimplex carlsbadense]ELZ30493.1 hypothetical protein C475_00075 [Halosimplex carlsbadense 2-9-1]
MSDDDPGESEADRSGRRGRDPERPDGGRAVVDEAEAVDEPSVGPGDGTGSPSAGASGRDGEAAGAAVASDADAADAPADGTETAGPATATVRSSRLRSTNHWVGFATLVFGSAGLGAIVRSRPLMLAAVVGVGYLAYANTTEAPEPELTVERRLSEEEPEPGDTVEVTVVVENVGEAALADLRVVEQVPEALAVTDGPARAATALRPGARMTFSYTVLARRGAYRFEGLTVIARNASGSRERELDVGTEPAAITCLAPVDATETVPLRGLTSPYTGRVSTDSSGEGTEFASLREYQHGDSLSRIDWNTFARDRTLTTMEFREERMATVVVVLDLRPGAYLQAGDDGPHAVDRGIDAARRVFNSLLDTGDRVGIAAFAAETVWLSPGAGPTHRARARELLSTHSALSPLPPDGRVYVRLQLRRLAQRLDDDAQVVFVSPMPDDTSTVIARSLHVRGHAVTVLSPDPTMGDTPGRRLAAVDRSNRLNDLRGSDVRVVDWDGDERLAEALERAGRRWSG